MKLVLFDIDGTLLDSGGAGTRSLNKAFRELFSVEHAFGGISMAGKTDIAIINEALARFGLLNGRSPIDAVMKAYVGHLKTEMENDRKHLKPGVISALQMLQGRPDCLLGLLTGNIIEGAAIKLDAFGLTKYFISPGKAASITDGIGAYGTDNEDRSKLLPFAVKRFKEHTGLSLSYADCIVVGDTPLDVSAVKPYGAVAVAVATGPFSTAQLRQTEADVVLPDLSNPAPLLGLL